MKRGGEDRPGRSLGSEKEGKKKEGKMMFILTMQRVYRKLVVRPNKPACEERNINRGKQREENVSWEKRERFKIGEQFMLSPDKLDLHAYGVSSLRVCPLRNSIPI